MDRLSTLFFVFLQIGLFSIGGGYATIPLIQEKVVQNMQWLDTQAFTDIITISQMTPGPLAVNTASFVGIRIAGVPGAIVATAGCICAGVLLSLLLYRTFAKHRDAPLAAYLMDGLRAASTGLIAAAAGTLLVLALYHTSAIPASLLEIDWTAFLIFGVCLFVLRKWKASPMLVMVLTGAVGVLLYA